MSELSKQQLAAEKLDKELKKAKEKDFAEPIIGYLKQRINEDEGFAEDVLKESKTWSGCFSYVYDQAKKMAGGQKALGVRNDVVFEWAEDYFRKDDKDLKASKKSSSAGKKAKQTPTKPAEKPKASTEETKSVDNVEKTVDKATESVSMKPTLTESVSEKPKKEKKPKPKKEDMSGQLSIFDLFGGLDG